jgi:hypothetical protein
MLVDEEFEEELPPFSFSVDFEKLFAASIYSPPLEDVSSPALHATLAALGSFSFFHFSFYLPTITSTIISLIGDDYFFDESQNLYSEVSSKFDLSTFPIRSIHTQNIIPPFIQHPILCMNRVILNYSYIRSDNYAGSIHTCMKTAFQNYVLTVERNGQINIKEILNREDLISKLYDSYFVFSPSLFKPLFIYVLWTSYLFTVGFSIARSVGVPSQSLSEV